jgi:hypothetical protein
VHPPPGQRTAGAQQYVERGTSCTGNDATEGLTQIHMNRLLVI